MKSRHFLTAVAVALAMSAQSGTAVAADELSGDAITRNLLRKPEFTQVALSPDGSKLALARRVDKSVVITVHNRGDMSPLISFDPGYGGEITKLRWLDDERLLVGATRIDNSVGFALFSPILLVATLDGKRPTELPYDIFSLVEGDKDHVLVHDCTDGPGNNGCNVPQIRRKEIGSAKQGELLIEGPPDTRLVLNNGATAGFAIKWEDDDTGRTYAYKPADKSWTLLNDGSKTGLEVEPLGVTKDGKTGYLQSERKDGPDAIEKYDFANGQRTLLYADAGSDPISLVSTLDATEAIGALYEPTNPHQYFWNPGHPDTQFRSELQAAFPGQIVDILSRSKDNNILVLAISSDRDPGTWYLFDRQARTAKAITREYPWLDPKQQATQTSIELKARDGLTLHGVITLPPGSSGKNMPLVVMPHGGPFGVRDAKMFDPDVQILGQHGYAVLQVNFRGSGGYGRAFYNAGAKQWGLGMLDDLTDATHWAIAQGIADARRICIFGMSYGGYAALEAPIREPGLYKCAASYAGPSDLAKITQWDSHHRDKLSRKWLAKTLGEGPELDPYSPALHTDKFNVPLLLANGYRDALVGVRHAQVMHNRLRERGVPVDYIEYPDTGHYLVLEKHREDFYTRLLRLLDQNIGPEPNIHAAPAKSE